MNGINAELMWGINKANDTVNKGRNKVDFFYYVNLNKAYNRYDGAIGTEIWLHPNCSQDTKNKANRILNNFAKLGFRNRGIKYSNGLAELNLTTMEAMIIECFFCEATEDVELYKKLGAYELGFVIANGIDLSIVSLNSKDSKPIQFKKEKYRNVIVYKDGAEPDKVSAEFMALILNYRNEDAVAIPLSQVNKYEDISVFCIGAARVSANKTLRGNNRYGTAENVFEHLMKTHK